VLQIDVAAVGTDLLSNAEQQMEFALASKQNGRQQWLVFCLGLAASVPLGIAVNFLYALVTR
jgi:hypothetical protein